MSIARFPGSPRGERGELETFTMKVLIAIGLIAAGALIWSARGVLLLVFIAAVLAAGISPAVRTVRIRWRYWFGRKLSRGAAVMVVYLPFLAGVLLVALLIVPRFVADTRELGQKLPALLEENVLKPAERYLPVGFLRQELADGVELPRSRVFMYMRNAAAAFASIVAVLFMVAYMLIDAERLRNLFLLVYSPDVRGKRRSTLLRIGKRMSAWLSGQLILSAIIGVATFFGLVALRIPYALPLAILAAIGELIPVLGPTLGAIPALGIALLHSRWQFWSVLVFAVLLQKAENLFIVPRVMSSKVEVSPLAIFIAFMIGASVLGVVGAIIAIPVAAIVQVAFDEAFVRPRERRLSAERPGTLLRKAD
jgi:predicted PurR-regulated permease PerM